MLSGYFFILFFRDVSGKSDKKMRHTQHIVTTSVWARWSL